MKFEELDIKATYDSRRTSVYDEFFVKILSNSKYYYRFGGIFSAKRFALTAEGMQDFIKENNGTMQLVIIPTFSEEDVKALLDGISEEEIITKNWIRDLSEIKEKFVEDHLKALSWMIANNYLMIKLALPIQDDGKLLSIDDIQNHAMIHREIGIFFNSDDLNSKLSFHGVIERENSSGDEIYSIDVSRDWIDSEKEGIGNDFDDFSNFWSEDNEECFYGNLKFKVINLTSKLTEYLNQIAPKTKEDIPKLWKPPVLRDYQREAISSWITNNHRGIFEMATGTGKTFTSIGGASTLIDNEEKLLVIVTVPYTHLLEQWNRELERWNIKSITLEKGDWNQILRDEILVLNDSMERRHSVIITSHDRFKAKEFTREIEFAKIPVLLIADEAHHLGTFDAQHAFSKNYTYRLALSATIERYYDEDGTDFLRQFFSHNNKSTVFSFPLERAIKEGKLCQYYYHPYFIELTAEENEDYQELTKQAGKYIRSKDPEIKKKAEKPLRERAKIVKNAENKKIIFDEILNDLDTYKRLIIFCSERQFDWVEEKLKDFRKITKSDGSIRFRRITYNEPKDIKERVKVLKEFADEKWDIILANRVLNEGMDIPQAQRCIILSSTGNPAEFIQRRGRVLRIFDDNYKDGSKKTHSVIYDVFVKPDISSIMEPEDQKMEISMVRSQLNRIRHMGDLAINDCEENIEFFTAGMPNEVFDVDYFNKSE